VSGVSELALGRNALGRFVGFGPDLAEIGCVGLSDSVRLERVCQS
jgi:hypothetical protein